MKKIDYKSVPRRNWIHLTIWGIIILLFSIWAKDFWIFVLIFPFFFDGYITKLIPWRWWEKSDSKMLRSTMKLIEDIVVVLILVHLLNLFIFQQFKIPTSSLEKTNLVGDQLFVSKLTYGARAPMTPIAFPLVHNQFPWNGHKAYMDKPQLKYKRFKGLRNIERNDIVVFNFPAGDTVALNKSATDYYTLVHYFGRERIWSDQATFGKVVARPVDMRDHYVKRLVGLPGDTLQLVNNDLFINGKKQAFPEKAQLNYFVQTKGNYFSEDELMDMGISKDDILVLNGQDVAYAPLFRDLLHLDSLSANDFGIIYHFPLTNEMRDRLIKHSNVHKIVLEPSPNKDDFSTFPLGMDNGWIRDTYGPIWIPKKGATIRLTTDNLPLYERCIRNFEGHTLSVKGGKISIDGQPATSYTFAMNYYFMMGDNRHNSADSRAWGFVPEDHIVGTPLFVWLSTDKDKPYFKGRIRWNRFFIDPK